VEAAAGSVAWNEVSNRPLVSRGASAAAVARREAGRIVERREVGERCERLLGGLVDDDRVGEGSSAWTIRWPTASTAPASSKNAASIP